MENIVETGLQFKGHKILLAPRRNRKADHLIESLMYEFLEKHFSSRLLFRSDLEFKDYDPHTQS